MKGFRPDIWKLITVVILILFIFFLVYPMFSMLIKGFQDPATGEWTLKHYQKFFNKRYYYRALINSFKVTFSVTLLAILVGVPIAYFMSKYQIKGRRFLEIVIIISMMSPAFIGAYSWILLLGRNGVVTRFMSEHIGINTPSIYGFGGILLVFTLKLYPFIYIDLIIYLLP